jgi:(methylthio)acryloyl-CoA hydratase
MARPNLAVSGGVAAEPLLIELKGRVLHVGLNRPAKRNALNDAAIHALEQCFANPPAEARAAVLYGVGDTFCAGLDLSELADAGVAEGMQHSLLWHRAFEKIEFGRVPVVAVLKGAVIGGGLELACAAHIRVAEDDAFYALPEGQRGIFVGGGGSVRLPRLIGVARMADMMLTGRTYAAQDGVALGLSQYLVERQRGLEKAAELAERMAGNAPLTNFAVMHALPRIAEADPRTGYLTEALMAAIAQGDQEAKNRLRDFLEKRAGKVKAPD